jgi:hypothetical protein
LSVPDERVAARRKDALAAVVPAHAVVLVLAGAENLEATASAATAPSECPATAICDGSILPASTPFGRASRASSLVMTKLTSRGSLTRSDWVGPPGAFAFSSGNTGAATT